MEAAQAQWVKIHPLIVRITHWINAFGILIMVASGWRIYNASPLFPFRIPNELTLGGWLAGALQWHFAAMWLLVINGIVYVTYGVVSGHFRRKLLPITPRAVFHDVQEALRGISRDHRVRRRAGLLGAGDLEAGSVAGDHGDFRRL